MSRNREAQCENSLSRSASTSHLLLDHDCITAINWGIDIYPSSFLISTECRIRHVSNGPRNWDSSHMIQAIVGIFAK